MGAAGRDFHNFNVYYRKNTQYEVVAFTAAQIPNIEKRKYPAALAGPNYPEGIPIFSEDKLIDLIRELTVEEVVFAYSDVSHEYVMHQASKALSNGPDFRLMGPMTTMLKSKVPLISVCATRTGAGKSQTSRKVAEILKNLGYKIVIIRHPMPYCDLSKDPVQRYASYEDLDKYACTIEEREEYEPHILRGNTIYAGVDYEKILVDAEKEAEIIIWDGGNNDLPFYRPDLHIVVTDPHRPGHELTYHPGETNLRMANVVIINKVDTADPLNVETVRKNVRSVNLQAQIVEVASPITVDKPELVTGKRVVVVEDGPTLTHGQMSYGAGALAAKMLGAKELVDPRPYAVGSIAMVFEKYPHLKSVLPAMGYDSNQIQELEQTINAVPCDTVLVGTPIDLRRFLNLNKPSAKASYELKEIGTPTLEEILKKFLLQQHK
jgi:predicted GTPase